MDVGPLAPLSLAETAAALGSGENGLAPEERRALDVLLLDEGDRVAADAPDTAGAFPANTFNAASRRGSGSSRRLPARSVPASATERAQGVPLAERPSGSHSPATCAPDGPAC